MALDIEKVEMIIMEAEEKFEKTTEVLPFVEKHIEKVVEPKAACIAFVKIQPKNA